MLCRCLVLASDYPSFEKRVFSGEHATLFCFIILEGRYLEYFMEMEEVND